LKDGPTVRGSYKTSRASSTAALRLLVSSRGVATAHTSETRLPSGHNFSTAGSALLPNLRFENCLPINLRGFLIAELGTRIYIDDYTIAPSAGEAPEAFMRDLARAIRRFSFTRAHEPWIEVASGRLVFEEGLRRSRSGACEVVLCLRCRRLDIGREVAAEHQDASCVAVPLHPCEWEHEAEQNAAGSALRRHLYREIANFRRLREQQAMPHYELDYYVRDNFYVFTWRPLFPAWTG